MHQGWSPQPQQEKGLSGLAIGAIIGGALLLVIGICVAVFAFTLRRAPRAARVGPPSTTAAPAPAALEVSAQTLYADYHANEISADEKYKGKKILLVDGKLASIDKDAFGDMVLRYATTDDFHDISATLKDSEKSKAMLLVKGKVQPVLCRGGGMILGSPTLDDCVLTDPPPTTPTPPTTTPTTPGRTHGR